MKVKRVVVLGPPGSGKGTQAELIKRACRTPHISTGEILREAAVRKSELGRQAEEYMEAGELVPDDIMFSIVRDRLQQPDCKPGFVLDGFPRTVLQARKLNDLMTVSGMGLDVVLSIEVKVENVIERLANRRLCRACGRDFNLVTHPPKEKDRCDHCGGELYQRADDTVETITNRLKVYEEVTAPLKDYYAGAQILKEVDGNGDVEEVFRRIASHLNCAAE